jgi:hypothetical protein
MEGATQITDQKSTNQSTRKLTTWRSVFGLVDQQINTKGYQSDSN